MKYSQTQDKVWTEVRIVEKQTEDIPKAAPKSTYTRDQVEADDFDPDTDDYDIEG